MKTKIKTLAFVMVLLGITLQAKSTVITNKADVIHETEKTIKQHITFPNIILPIHQSEKVEVIFITSESGKVNFALAKTDNRALKQIIEKEFSDLTLPAVKSNVAHSIVIHLKKV
jgi:hypothetical protein